jgi:endonuclease/exonuclease/phosphatase family metal-dependent hydrolase
MNERSEYFCRVTAATTLLAAAGGSNTGSCRPPKQLQIDWIFGSPGAAFSNFRVDRSALVRRTTDHPVVVADVHLSS